MITVVLNGAEFFARHGFYAEEQLLGCRFEVDMEVGFAPQGDLNNDNLANTVNYEGLYAIAAKQMQHTRQLIETVAQAITDDIKENYPYVETISVSVKKINPPMKGRVAYSGVTITYNRV